MSHEAPNHAAKTAERFLALSQVGTALMRELDETRLLHLIAQTACDLTGAMFAAFSLRPVDDEGQPLVPSEGQFFSLAAVVGVTAEQEALFRRMPLGGEGLLAPIFRQGVPVLVADVLSHLTQRLPDETANQAKASAREAAAAYAQGEMPSSELPSLGVPAGHPLVRSFLGAPLLDREGAVRGGLLLGHQEPDQFTQEDQTILESLASQAAVALENARLYRMTQTRAQQLDALFESITDGVTLVDSQGTILRENRAALFLRTSLAVKEAAKPTFDRLLSTPAQLALSGKREEQVVEVVNGHQEERAYLVISQPFHPRPVPSGPLGHETDAETTTQHQEIAGAVVVWHDITAQREQAAAQAAQAHARQLEAIFEAMTDAVFVVDQAGHLTLTNTAARRLHARILPAEETAFSVTEYFRKIMLTDAQGDILPFDQWPVARILQGEILTPEQAVEISLPTLDGNTLETQMTGGPLHEANGDLAGAVVIVRDVTRRKRAQRESERQMKQLRLQAQLIELAHDAIVVRDPDSFILAWNQGAKELYGWTAEQAVGQVTHTLLQTHFPNTKEAVDQVLAQTGHWEGQLVHTRRDGSQVIVESRQVQLHDEQKRPWALLEVNRDITERLQLEQREHEAKAEAEAQQELLQLILDELPSSISLVRGLEARLMLANRAATALWGEEWPYDQPMQTFLATHQIQLSQPTGEPLPPEQWVTLRAVQERKTIRGHQEIIRRSNGSNLPVLVNAVALGTTGRLARLPALFTRQDSEDSEPLGLVVHQDVTALKEAEYLKDEFIGLAAHELRNPVAALSGFAQMLVAQTKRGKGAALTPWQLETLDEIVLASTRLVDLTEELLDVTRVQAGRLYLQRTRTDLVALAQRMITRLQLTTEHCQLSLQASASHIFAQVDQARMEQVFSNLLSNAIKYSPDGGPVEIQVQEQPVKAEILLRIQDHGMGIPKDQQANIFTRFMRAKNAQEAGISGTGLGLYLCRELVELHGGHIWFESIGGEGTIFFVTLPQEVSSL